MTIRERIRRRLDAISASAGLKPIREMEGPVQALTPMAGHGAVLLFASNDYLGLANHPDVVAAAKDGLDAFGAGTGGARFICGTTSAHLAFERELAAFLGMEAALTLPSGFAANVALISTLAEPGDLILSDALNHASLIDGCRMAPTGVKTVVYPHGDAGAVARALSEPREGHAFIVSDGVFSMEGDLAPLPDLDRLAREHGATLIVDDAHGLGVLGATGAGIGEHFGIRPGADILTGSLGKAIGGTAGGFVAGPAEVIALLTQAARPQLFSTALPAASVVASRAALAVLVSHPEITDEIRHKARLFRDDLRRRGLPVPRGETPIVPLVLERSDRARAVAADLLREGIYAAPITFPAVPEASARIRFQVSRHHSVDDLLHCAETVERCVRRFGSAA